jgi:hypothetical protein
MGKVISVALAREHPSIKNANSMLNVPLAVLARWVKKVVGSDLVQQNS